jgi:hypothetical protein
MSKLDQWKLKNVYYVMLHIIPYEMKNKVHFLLFDRRGAVVSTATMLHNNTASICTRTAFSHLPKYYIIIHCNRTTAVHHIFCVSRPSTTL